jgi:prepilin-type N-terminal cleavage/methylation domain-containing protein
VRVPRRWRPGFTLIEVVLAAALLAACAVPILSATSRAPRMGDQIKARTTSALLAQTRMENVLAAATVNFNQNFTRNNDNLGDGYLATTQQVWSPWTPLTKTVTVQVGKDLDGDALLETNEVLVTLTTLVADTGSQ